VSPSERNQSQTSRGACLSESCKNVADGGHDRCQCLCLPMDQRFDRVRNSVPRALWASVWIAALPRFKGGVPAVFPCINCGRRRVVCTHRLTPKGPMVIGIDISICTYGHLPSAPAISSSNYRNMLALSVASNWQNKTEFRNRPRTFGPRPDVPGLRQDPSARPQCSPDGRSEMRVVPLHVARMSALMRAAIPLLWERQL
jgi:hypothetical protein